MKVTEVSRHSYCVYYLLDSSAYVITSGIKSRASELGKRPLFRRTVCGPNGPGPVRSKWLPPHLPVAVRMPSAASETCGYAQQ